VVWKRGAGSSIANPLFTTLRVVLKELSQMLVNDHPFTTLRVVLKLPGSNLLLGEDVHHPAVVSIKAEQDVHHLAGGFEVNTSFGYSLTRHREGGFEISSFCLSVL
jgi:hypothetical protein